MNELIGAATLVVTAVGLWFAYNRVARKRFKLLFKYRESTMQRMLSQQQR